MSEPSLRQPRPAGVEAASAGNYHDLIGMKVVRAEPGRLEARIELRPELHNPMGAAHGGALVALADSVCGYAVLTCLPEGATSFTTVNLTASFLSSAREGQVRCTAELLRSGRTTQVWDAQVETGEGRPLAAVRCTQLLRYSRGPAEDE